MKKRNETSAAGRRFPRTKTDVAALAVFFALAAILLAAARLSWVHVDEFFYYAIPQRVLNGDKLFYDEWGYTQFTSLFHLLPFFLYTKLAGGTDGVVVFMRHYFILFALGMYWAVYLLLRKRAPVPALLAAALFAADTYCGTLTLSYYNVCTYSAALVGLLLFLPEGAPSKKRLVCCGILTAFAVMCEPVLIVSYLIFSLLVLLHVLLGKKQKSPLARYDHILNGRGWLYLTAGAATVAAALLTYLLITVGAAGLLDTLPRIFAANPYDISSGGGGKTLAKLTYLTEKFSAVNCVLLLLAAGAAAVLSVLRRKSRELRLAEAGTFLFALLAFVSCFVYELFTADPENAPETFFRSGTFPVFFLTLTNYILLKKKDRRMFTFWLLSALLSLPMDLSSNFTFLAFGRLSYIPAVFLTRDAAEELFPGLLRRNRGASADAAEGKKDARLLSRLCAAALCAVLLCQFGSVLAQMEYYPLLTAKVHANLMKCEAGPSKGIFEEENYCLYHYSLMQDVDAFRDDCDGPLYIAAGVPYCYLYASLPVSSYMPLYNPGDMDGVIQAYWKARPENRPKYIYIPNFDTDALGTSMTENYKIVSALCENEMTVGKAGLIVKVLRWYDDADGGGR
ncbi:MAG: hypothetical protein IJL26_00320 [Clostridia bacterium]|nr:hypothetical protein [Clostridia bacterium]